jgi:hypothetical protein
MQYTTKNLLIFTFILLGTYFVNGQDKISNISQQRELGLRFSGFDDFNLFYKRHMANGKVRRHRFLSTQLAFNSINTNFDLAAGYAFGVERYSPITEELSFYRGLEYSLFLDYDIVDSSIPGRSNNLRAAPAIGYIIGFQYAVSSRFALSLEVIPSLIGSFNYRDGGIENYQVNFSLNSNSTALSLMYRFTTN